MQPLRLLLHRQEIGQRVEALAQCIDADYRGRAPVLLAVLKGAFVFLADLVRHLHLPLEIEFVRLASYGTRTQTSGQVELLLGPRLPLTGRDVIIVEDIIDTGLSVRWLVDYLERQRPATIRVCALLVRSTARSDPALRVDYVGFEIGQGFVVGYGLDMGEKYRSLPDIYVVEGTA